MSAFFKSSIFLLALSCLGLPAWAGNSGGPVAISSGPTYVTVEDLNVGATGDTPAAIPYARYVVRRVTLSGATANLATATATLGLYTDVAAGGIEIVVPGLLTALTGSSVVMDFATPVIGTARTEPILQLRIVQGLAPVAGTVDVSLEIQPLP